MEKNCPSCKLTFNASDHYMFLLSCDDAICFTCFENQFQPQNNQIQCPTCNEDIKISQKFKDRVSHIRDLAIPTFNICCDDHDSSEADYYCEVHKMLMCIKCAFNKCKDHQNSAINLKKDEIDQYVDNGLEKVNIQIDRFVNLRELLLKIKNKSSKITSTQAIGIITQLQKDLIHFQDSQEDKISLKFPQNAKIGIQIVPQQQPICDFDQHSLTTFNITPNECNLLKQWIGNANIKLDLIYRGTRDGLNANAFHQIADNQGPTIVIAKNHLNKVFGGYTQLSWKSANEWVSDPTAFIFSLTNKTKHAQHFQPNKCDKSICHADKSYLFVFGQEGQGCEFYLEQIGQVLKARQNSTGPTFIPPEGMKPGSQQFKEYLMGTKEDQNVLELEVYKVIE